MNRHVMHTTLAYLLGGNQEERSRLSGVGFAQEQDAFICDVWYLLDFNHQACRYPIFPGLSAYAIPTFDVGGPGSEHWARSSTLPDIKEWPLGEQRIMLYANKFELEGLIASASGTPGANVFVQFFEVVGTPRIQDNGTPTGTEAKHRFSKNHRCDGTLPPAIADLAADRPCSA